MKVVVLEHFRVPYQNAGSEVFMHRLQVALMKAGHEVAVVTTDTPRAPEQELYDGMWCYSTGQDMQRIESMLRNLRPDVILTHHQRAMIGIPFARKIGASSVFVMHNDFAHNQRVLMYGPGLTVFNTQWIADRWRHRAGLHMVIHPPVLPGQCDLPPGNLVTLININRDKGSEVLYAVAERLPQFGFLGVIGAHGEQYVRRDLSNVVIQDHTVNMCQDVWARTKVLLMPSIYESYGMTGIEACYQGIPVLANPTPGLLESLGQAGWFIERTDVAGYADAVESLLTDEGLWQSRSLLALDRGAEIDAQSELDQFVQRVEALVARERNRV